MCEFIYEIIKVKFNDKTESPTHVLGSIKKTKFSVI